MMRIQRRVSAVLVGACALAACSSFAPGPAVPISEEPETGAFDASGIDATSIPSGQSLNGCAQASYADRSAASADRTVYFGGAGTSGPFVFSPACMVVSPGQTVTFSGDFSVHPLSPGSSPDALTSGTAGSPIRAHTTDDSSYTVTFGASGTFPFFCENHYASGMYGAIRVR